MREWDEMGRKMRKKKLNLIKNSYLSHQRNGAERRGKFMISLKRRKRKSRFKSAGRTKTVSVRETDDGFVSYKINMTLSHPTWNRRCLHPD